VDTVAPHDRYIGSTRGGSLIERGCTPDGQGVAAVQAAFRLAAASWSSPAPPDPRTGGAGS